MAKSQEPNYFVIGEDELINVDVFSIIQTNKEQLIISSNKGLFSFDDGAFIPIKKAKEQIGLSLFNLIENDKNEVFCLNLSGQIFKLKNNTLSLYFQIPKKYLSQNMTMQLDHQSNLILASKGFYKINKNGITILDKGNKTSRINILPNGELIGSYYHKDTLLKFTPNGIEKFKINLNGNSFGFANNIFQVNGELLWNIKNKIVSSKKSKIKSNVSLINDERYLQVNDKEIWAMQSYKGIRLYKENDNIIYQSEIWFKDYFISSMTIGVNNTLFMGTFGGGILVVPNRNNLHYNYPIKKGSINKIAVDSNNRIFLSEKNKGIVQYHLNKQHLVYANPTNSSQDIFYHNNANYDINKDIPELFYHLNKPSVFHSVKNITQVNDSSNFFATSIGIWGVGLDDDLASFSHQKMKPNKNVFKITKGQERCSSVAYDKEKKMIYYSSNNGTYSINKIK